MQKSGALSGERRTESVVNSESTRIAMGESCFAVDAAWVVHSEHES